jgi:putative oxidoreductase
MAALERGLYVSGSGQRAADSEPAENTVLFPRERWHNTANCEGISPSPGGIWMHPYGPAVLRLTIGAVFIAHGAQKLFGIWGGPGLTGTATFMGQLGLGPGFPLALLVGLVEFGGGLLLVAGALTMFAALALAIDMAVAIWKVHSSGGFFLPNGYEYALVLLGALICLMLTGPGAFSIDAWRARSAEAEAYGRARLRAGKV